MKASLVSRIAAVILILLAALVSDHFVPMSPRSEGWFTCVECGHTAIPEKPEFKCFCQKCGELNRAA
jgi:hypothetical protein